MVLRCLLYLREIYSSLFAEESVELETQNHLFSFVSRRLSEHECDVCKGALLLDEATEAVGLSNRNKAPGPDGLSVEFYLTFWSRLGPLLVEVFNEGLRESELCDSMKTSITRLVYKKDDRRNLKNWRPISLLNVDYKICSKAISLRPSKVLDSIVDPDQTCPVPGRSIASNLFLLRGVLDHIERTGETGILVSLDQEKAGLGCIKRRTLKLLTMLMLLILVMQRHLLVMDCVLVMAIITLVILVVMQRHLLVMAIAMLVIFVIMQRHLVVRVNTLVWVFSLVGKTTAIWNWRLNLKNVRTQILIMLVLWTIIPLLRLRCPPPPSPKRSQLLSSLRALLGPLLLTVTAAAVGPLSACLLPLVPPRLAPMLCHLLLVMCRSLPGALVTLRAPNRGDSYSLKWLCLLSS